MDCKLGRGEGFIPGLVCFVRTLLGIILMLLLLREAQPNTGKV